MADMTTPNRHTVSIAVLTDQQLGDDQARTVATRWTDAPNVTPALTSTSLDEPWLRVSAVVQDFSRDVPALVAVATERLVEALRDVGAAVTEWQSVEVLSEPEAARRAARPAIPPMVNAAQLADLAGTTVQRIYQLESERKAGKRSDFPAPILDGYWLRSVGEHWANTRRTKPGPAPKAAE